MSHNPAFEALHPRGAGSRGIPGTQSAPEDSVRLSAPARTALMCFPSVSGLGDLTVEDLRVVLEQQERHSQEFDAAEKDWAWRLGLVQSEPGHEFDRVAREQSAFMRGKLRSIASAKERNAENRNAVWAALDNTDNLAPAVVRTVRGWRRLFAYPDAKSS